MWWKPKRGSMNRDLRPLAVNRNALQLSEYAENKKEEVEIYVEHVVSTTNIIDFVEWLHNGAKGAVRDGAINVNDELYRLKVVMAKLGLVMLMMKWWMLLLCQ